jgi:hypothetical protein
LVSTEAAIGTNDYKKSWDVDTCIVGSRMNPYSDLLNSYSGKDLILSPPPWSFQVERSAVIVP